jgi:hypothetical protein
VLVESNADLDIMDKAGHRPLADSDALKELRGGARHASARRRQCKLAFERRMCATDVRYVTQRAHI